VERIYVYTYHYIMSKKNIPEHQHKKLEEMSLAIKNWRLNENLTQLEFSEIAEIHVNTLQKIEKHSSNISVLTLFSIIDAMDGMTQQDFFEMIK